MITINLAPEMLRPYHPSFLEYFLLVVDVALLVGLIFYACQ